MSSRFFSESPPENGRIVLGREEARHLHKVCRLGTGDTVQVFNGRGSAWQAEILESSANSALLQTLSEPLVTREPTLSVSIASAVPKGDRLDWLIEKATELGAERFIPLSTAYSVVDPRDSKLARLRRAVVESCKQCRRDTLMTIEPVMSWQELMSAADGPLKLLADPDGRPPSDWPPIVSGRPVILAVGPEGGFSPAERSTALEREWQPINLGVYILRMETAAIAGCASLFAREEHPRT